MKREDESQPLSSSRFCMRACSGVRLPASQQSTVMLSVSQAEALSPAPAGADSF